LDIGGESQIVVSAGGGTAVGIVTSTPSADGQHDKRLSGVNYEDIIIEVSPTALPKSLADVLSGKYVPLSGSLRFGSFDYKTVRRLSFQNAMISSVRFPALDAASKEAARVEFTLSPESTKEEAVKGEDMKGAASSKQKSAMVNFFRVQLGELPANRVSKVTPIELRAESREAGASKQRGDSKEPAGFEIPNIKLTISAVDAEPWRKWHHDSVISGKTDEKTMVVELVDATMKDVLLGLELTGVGIVAVRDEPQESVDKIARIEVEVYAEGLRLISNKSVAATAAPAATPAPAAAAPVARKKRAAPAEAAPAAEPAKSEVPPASEKPVRRAR